MNKSNRKTLLDLALNVDGERMEERENSDEGKTDISYGQLNINSGLNHSVSELAVKTAGNGTQNLTTVKHQPL